VTDGRSPLRRVRETVVKALSPPKEDVIAIDYVMAVAASHFIPIALDPVWAWLIGPPGAMKTELLRGFRGADGAVLISSLTPNSLCSGYDRDDGKDPSLLPIINGKLLVVKDFTAVMELPEVQVRGIFGSLRDIYDGFHGKAFGTVGIRDYDSIFSMISASTPSIDEYTLVHTPLGERFVSLRICRTTTARHEDRFALGKRVWAATETKSLWREEIAEEYARSLEAFEGAACLPDTPDDIRDTIIKTASLLTLFRSLPHDSSYSDAELPTRTQQQLHGVVAGRALADGRTALTKDDLPLLRRVAIDTLPAVVGDTLAYLAQWSSKNSGFLPYGKIKDETGAPIAWIERVMHQYRRNNLVVINGKHARMEDETLEVVKRTGFFHSHPRHPLATQHGDSARSTAVPEAEASDQ